MRRAGAGRRSGPGRRGKLRRARGSTAGIASAPGRSRPRGRCRRPGTSRRCRCRGGAASDVARGRPARRQEPHGAGGNGLASPSTPRATPPRPPARRARPWAAPRSRGDPAREKATEHGDSLTVRTMSARVDSVLPGLALHLGVTPQEPLAGGEFGALLVTDADDRSLVLKALPAPELAARFIIGAELAGRLLSAGYPAPRYHGTGVDFGLAWSLQELLPGAIPDVMDVAHSRRLVGLGA